MHSDSLSSSLYPKALWYWNIYIYVNCYIMLYTWARECSTRTVDVKMQLHNKTNKLILKTMICSLIFQLACTIWLPKSASAWFRHRMSRPSVWTVQQTRAWKDFLKNGSLTNHRDVSWGRCDMLVCRNDARWFKKTHVKWGWEYPTNAIKVQVESQSIYIQTPSCW